MLHGWVSGTNSDVYVSVHPSVSMYIYMFTYPNPSHALHLSILYLSAQGKGARRRSTAPSSVGTVPTRVSKDSEATLCVAQTHLSFSSLSLSPPLPLPLSFSHTQVQVRAVYVADGAHSVGCRTTMRHASSSRPRRLSESRQCQPVGDTTRKSGMPAVQTDAQGWICVSRFND